jgi:glutathione S-transferase
MLTIHYLEHSRAHRVLWLCEELGLDYAVKTYARDPRNLSAPRALRDIHPLGKSPVITEGELVLAESGAVLEYLCEKAGGALVPKRGSADWLRYVFWLHHAEGSAMPILQSKLIFEVIPSQVPWVIRPVARAISRGVLRARIDPDLRRAGAFWEAELSTRPWFAGQDFTAADIQMSYPVEALLTRMKGDYPALSDFLARIRARPAWIRAAERGGLGGDGSPIPETPVRTG